VLETRPSGLFNLAFGQSHSVNEIISLVEEVSGRRLHVTYRDAFEWDVACSRLDITRMRRELGWEPRIDIRAGIGDLWQHAASADDAFAHLRSLVIDAPDPEPA
jgi:UDP-glucose 4-epimerase